MRFLSKLLAHVFALLGVFASSAALAQGPAGRVVLVLPFDNRSGDPSLNWIGDSFPDTLNKRLSSAGFLTISHDDRVYAYDHLGLPTDLQPSRATSIRIAQQLDANFIIIGSYNVEALPGKTPAATDAPPRRISIQARVLSLDNLSLTSPVEDSAEITRLFDAENAIAWKVARSTDPHFNVAEATFLAAPGAVPLPAFEDYIRGIDTQNPAERLKRLQSAVGLVPNYSAALLALGKEQYATHDYAAASITLTKFQPNDRLALEAGFYLGLARFNNANYPGAAQAFEIVAAKLPLPEVLNNQAVALSRQGKDAVALFQRVAAADPSDSDYHYNLAVAEFRNGDTANALNESATAIKLKPGDNEAVALHKQLTSVAPGTKLTSNALSNFTAVERIRRTYSETSYRQAAFQLDEVRSARLSMLPASERASQYTQLGREYLGQGLLPEAETQFQSAIAADSRSAEAHAGLAQIRDVSGDTTQARNEANTSIRIKPTAAAYLVLARIDLAASNLPACADDVTHAQQLEPKNSAVAAMRTTLLARGQTVPAP
jgi:Flp pilus assembly protein TadD/TolB-like protein